jgi:hypothetical protein
LTVAVSERITQLAQAQKKTGLTTDERQAVEIDAAREEARLRRERNAKAVQRQAKENARPKVADSKDSKAATNNRPATPLVSRVGGTSKANLVNCN